jgi:hypothetical protein
MEIGRRCGALGILAALGASLQAQSVLEITSPEDGTVVHPGHVVGVTVSARGALVKDVAIIGWDPIGFSRVLTSPPYQFDIEIPMKTTPGKYLLTAVGNAESGALVQSESIMIDVERPDLPQKIAAGSRQLDLTVGDQLPIGVTGTYADGSIVYLDKSTQTTFASQNSAVATVANEGLVTAVAPGSTAIVIDGSLAVPVIVEPFIRIFPEKATLKASETREFTSQVTHPPNGKVTWTLNPNVGSVVNGLYTAPAALDSAQTVTLTASSVDNPALTASAIIALSPAASIDVVPGYAVLYQEQTQQFSATSANAGSAGVKWSVSPSGAGAISSTGLYTAPNPISSTQKVTITATSAANPAISGNTNIYISPRPFLIFPYPEALDLAPGATRTAIITLLATDRFWHPIALSVEGAPISVKTTLDDSTLTPNSSTYLTFTYENETVPGSYKITVVAQDTVYPVLKDSKTLTLNIGNSSH